MNENPKTEIELRAIDALERSLFIQRDFHQVEYPQPSEPEQLFFERTDELTRIEKAVYRVLVRGTNRDELSLDRPGLLKQSAVHLGRRYFPPTLVADTLDYLADRFAIPVKTASRIISDEGCDHNVGVNVIVASTQFHVQPRFC